MMQELLYLEHDGKVLLVDSEGDGPMLAEMGRTDWPQREDRTWLLRLPTQTEVESMGIAWHERRRNQFSLGDERFKVIHAIPDIVWPEHWAWKDTIPSDSAVHPAARESVYRSMHRLVAKVILRNPQGQILMAKVKRGFFTGHWTLCGGFLDYAEHPRDGVAREAEEELGISIDVGDPIGESAEPREGKDFSFVQSKIFTSEGINFVSFTYLVDIDPSPDNFKLKDDEIDEVKWFELDKAVQVAASLFDLDALSQLKKDR